MSDEIPGDVQGRASEEPKEDATLELRASGFIRIVVCLDIEAKTPTEAYEKFLDHLPLLYPHGIEGETTDEWFDVDGRELTEDEVMAARRAVFEKKGMLE